MAVSREMEEVEKSLALDNHTGHAGLPSSTGNANATGISHVFVLAMRYRY